MDICWCYAKMGMISSLDDAVRRLALADAAFTRSYGKNLERLSQLRGTTGMERALYMRMHLLMAIAQCHAGESARARLFLGKLSQSLFFFIDVLCDSTDGCE